MAAQESRIRKRPIGGNTAATGTTDTPILLPLNAKGCALFVDVASRVLINGSATVVVADATNMGYLEANSTNEYTFDVGARDTYLHIRTVSGAGNYRVTWYS